MSLKPGWPLEDFDFGSGGDVLSSMLVLSDNLDGRGVGEGSRQVGVGQRALDRVRLRRGLTLKENRPRLKMRQSEVK
jgi:hypothetical protein